MKFSVTLTTIAFFLIFGTRGSLTAQITPLFEKVIPWGGDTSAVGLDLIQPISNSIFILTYNQRFDRQNLPPVEGYRTLGSGILEIDSLGKIRSKTHFSTNSLNPQFFYSGYHRIPARFFYEESINNIKIPFSIHLKEGTCNPPILDNKFMMGNLDLRLDSLNKSKMSIFTDTENCEDYTSISVGVDNKRFYYFYIDEFEYVQTVGIQIRDLSKKMVKQIEISDKYYLYSKEYKALYDKENGVFLFYGFHTQDSSSQLVCLDTLGNLKWQTVIPAGGFDYIVDLKKHPSGYVLSKMKDKGFRDYTSHIYLLSEQGEILRTKELPESVIRDIEVGQRGIIFGIDDYFLINGHTSEIPSYAILILNSKLDVIHKETLGGSYVSAHRILSNEKNQIWVTGVKYNTLDPSVRKPSEIYLLKARLDLPEATCTDLSTYPNPADNHLTLETPLNLLPGERYTARLYDITGRVIQRYPELQDPARLDMSQISNGIYLLEVGEAGGNPCLRKKIVVSHE